MSSSSPGGVFQFTDSEKMKQKVRQSRAAKAKYRVEDFYHSDGICRQIATDPRFENVTLCVIVCNAIWIAVDTDWNTSSTLLDAGEGFIVADVLFFAYFSMELIIRFCAFERKFDCAKDAWFMFDTFLVALYAFDPFVMAGIASASGGGGLDGGSLPRLLRLARLSRLVRMLRALPELMIMIKGMVTAAGVVGYTLGLLVVLTYVFAIAMTQLASGTELSEDGAFLSCVAMSMYSLTIHATFLDDLADFADALKAQDSPIMLIVGSIFIVLASMTVMNMLIGILCEVISSVAEEERFGILTDTVNRKFEHVVAELDENCDGKVSYKEFQQIIDHPKALRAFESLKVDPEIVVDFAQDWFLDESGEPKQLKMEEFLDMVMDLRGGQNVTMKELMRMKKKLNSRFGDLTEVAESIEIRATRLREMIQAKR
jgi:voltage-gated sodium channel